MLGAVSLPPSAILTEWRTAMKRIVLCLSLTVCLPTAFAGYSDGFLTAEDGYQYFITWRSNQIPLIVDGGGALEISVRDNGCLIVQSTSTPLVMGQSGVYDILLFDSARLLYLDGVTEFIRVTQSNTVFLQGGSINAIKTMRFAATGNENIFIYAQNGWSWLDGDPMKGIQGKWRVGGSDFRIEFFNDEVFGTDPVWMSIKVIPEPAAVVLFGIGSILLRRKK